MAPNFLSKAALILAALATVQQVAAQLTKPLIQPPIPSLDGGLWDNLRPTQSNHDQWSWGWIPDRCKDDAIRNGYSPYDMEVFNVRYTDCNEAWVMCRHHNSPQSQINMIDLFGRMPVRARQYIRLVIAFPGARSAYTWSDLGDIVFFGDAQKSPTLYAHEIAHALDWNAVPGIPRFSTSQTWLNAYNADTAISDGYAATNQAENFAQETVIALFDRVVPGGIGTKVSNWRAIFNQYTAVRNNLGNVLVPGGTCQRRFPNAGVVCMGPAAGCGGARIAGAGQGAKPELTEDPNIPRIPVPEVPMKEPIGNHTH